MAENHPDKAHEIPDDELLADDLGAGAHSPGFDEAGSMEELSGASLEDTADPSSVQGQERASPENNDALSGFSTKKSDANSIEALVTYYEREMNKLLRWKEQLKLTSIEHQLSSAYYEMWIKEANLFFRRLVILRKRIETLKKQKRA